MVYERSDVLVKRYSFKNMEKNPLSLNECYFVHYHFLKLFNPYPGWDCLREGKSSLDVWLTLTNRKSFTLKCRKMT